ncbi:hypothetical protein [Lentzea sp. NPDC059081]|uniref:hypothetical protein n=1 Tax=Lentzea sp. NPDC059081 TaxID=3346719 RepID=UPI00368307EF
MTAATGAQFPPAQLQLHGTTWMRTNNGSATSAVYQCANHPGFHLTLNLRKPLRTTVCGQVHATPNNPVFENLHLWRDGDHNFHQGAEHYNALTKPQQEAARQWYLTNRGFIQELLAAAYVRLSAAKTAAFPAAQASSAPAEPSKKNAAKWEQAQENAAVSQKQHAAAEQRLQKRLLRVRKLLDHASLNFPDAMAQQDGTVHFVCDYSKWSISFHHLVVVWSSTKSQDKPLPDQKFKSLLSQNEVSRFFFVHGALTSKGRVAWAAPREHCTPVEMDDPGSHAAMQEIVRQRQKLEHLVANVVEPEGHAPGHVFLPSVGGLVKRSGWYFYNTHHTRDDASTMALDFNLKAKRLPRCIVRTNPGSGGFCAIELLTFVHPTKLTGEQTGTNLEYPVPDGALASWEKKLPEGEFDTKRKFVLVEGLLFHLPDNRIENDRKKAYEFQKPAFFLRASNKKKVYFDMSVLEQLDPSQAWKSDKKLRRAVYDQTSQLLSFPDKSTFPLPAEVFESLPWLPESEVTQPHLYMRIVIGPNDHKGQVVLVHDLHRATRQCVLLTMLGELYVIETSSGIRVATHLLQRCETRDDILVMHEDVFIGWIRLDLTYPLMEYLVSTRLVTPDCQMLGDVSVNGTTWWQVVVYEVECWVRAEHLEQVTTDLDEGQILKGVIDADGDGLVFVTDGAGTWMTFLSRFSTQEPAGSN